MLKTCSPIISIKGNGYTQRRQLSQKYLLLIEKGVYSKTKEFTRGAKSFVLEMTHFQQGFDVKKKYKQKVAQAVFLVKNGRTFTCVYSYLKYYLLNFLIIYELCHSSYLLVICGIKLNGPREAKNSFKHAQDAHIQITLRLRKVSSGPFLSVLAFYSVQ